MFILSVAVQVFFSLLLFNNNSDSTKHSAEHTTNTSATATNPEILQELQTINYKLDMQNQLIAELTHRDINKIDNQGAHNALPTSTPQLTETEILETKQALINDINKYDMTMPLFLSDARFHSLPSRTQSEILSEITRRLNNNEIDKKQFIPGYKP